ncbi:hypothetical protein ES708_16658 [subsurface metagenome]
MVKPNRWKPDPVFNEKDYAARLVCHGQIEVLDKLIRLMGFDRVYLSYTSPFWLELSRQVKVRDHQRCRSCGGTKTLDCHHIVPVKHGGTNLSGNLKTLCRKCHRVRHFWITWYFWHDITP